MSMSTINAIFVYLLFFSLLFPLLLPAHEWAGRKADFWASECRNGRKAFIYDTIAFILAVLAFLGMFSYLGMIICAIISPLF